MIVTRSYFILCPFSIRCRCFTIIALAVARVSYFVVSDIERRSIPLYLADISLCSSSEMSLLYILVQPVYSVNFLLSSFVPSVQVCLLSCIHATTYQFLIYQ